MADGGVSLAGEEPWQGIDDLMASAAVTPVSVAGALVETSVIDATLAVPNMPEIGMTAAMAPETGSHISIHNNKSLLKNVIRIRLNYHKKVPGCGEETHPTSFVTDCLSAFATARSLIARGRALVEPPTLRCGIIAISDSKIAWFAPPAGG